MKISKQKQEKISEQILNFLYFKSPTPIFTAHIAKEIARDEEFIKNLLLNLQKKKIVISIKKNKDGKKYIRRTRWKLSKEVFNIYSKNNNC